MLFLGHDLGTSGTKAVLVDERARVVSSAVASYALDRPREGWAEQSPEAWWRAVSETTRACVREAGVGPSDIGAIAFAGQMLSLVALDARGEPTRPAISWLDGRAEAQARRVIRRFGGERVLHWLAGAAPTGKDIVAKIAWLADEEPEVFARTAALTDATGFLVARATGELAIDMTAAGCTGMLVPETRRWSRLLSAMASFPLDKAPRLVPSTDVVGRLTARAAGDLGLAEGTRVVMGMADIPAAAVGSGATRPGDAHVYLGTSSWIGVSVDRPKSAARAGIASVPSADPRGFLLIGESETAGACRQWLASTLRVDDAELERLAASSEPGARGLLFLPWMYGERSPVPDTAVRGAFVGLSLEHEPRHLARALYEGVALNLAWILDEMRAIGEPCSSLRVIGGGAASDVWLEILADVTGRPVERVESARLAGAVGAALVAAVGVGAEPSVVGLRERVRVERTFTPRSEHRGRYGDLGAAMRELHRPLSRAARLLGRGAR
ncbi:MAG: FGGY-family carbohydrate kinase [Sandaracinaceae bacterium]|nr:FGGY-family carbohydrate kinase [Sandaracinaceae bacterium]